jgi:hypothetical protein
MSDRPAITGVVADVEDRFSIIISVGRDDGVETGMIFAVIGETGQRVVHPKTGDDLGPRVGEKLRVKVIEVYPQYSLAETYKIVSPLEAMSGDVDVADFIGSAGSIFGRQRIANQPSPSRKPAASVVVSVNVGDEVRELRD